MVSEDGSPHWNAGEPRWTFESKASAEAENQYVKQCWSW